ncbi:uncharacterized protein LOC117783036 [Drosophila innubila]|uniref:uncharacterized protein LOC117783036 n=1 Tax=Drosophila innubila TaxID=198719 RepID=UPI00148E571E|nr:uncharacterized protein LOC117783036 [Drosophila innubila]
MDTLKADLMLSQHSTVRSEMPPEMELHIINNSFVLDIIKRIDRSKKFKNFIFYVSEELNLNNPGGAEFFQNFWFSFPLVPRIFMRRPEYSPTLIRDLISTPTLVLVCTTSHTDPIMEVAAQSLRGMRWLKTVFILFPGLRKDTNPRDALWSHVKNVLDWTWSKQFTSTLLLTIENSLFVLNPYPTPRVENKTHTWRVSDISNEVHNAINTKGYQIKTPVLNDLPRVFKGTDRNTVYGTSANFFKDFLEFINATMLDTSGNLTMKAFDLPYLLELVTQGVYETLIHSFTDLNGNYSVSISHPIGINDWCIMVPYSSESVQELYVREALQDNVWLLLLLAVIYMTFAVWLCSPRRPRDLSGALLQCICSITNNPPLSIIREATLRMRFLYLIFFIMGLNSSNMYISKMTSYLTTAPAPRQLNTVQDIINANLRILAQGYEYDRLLKSPELYTPRFMQQVEVVSPEVLQNHRDVLNRSFGYMVPSDRWDFINMQQSHLNSPNFRLTDICSGPFYHVYPMHLDSHLRSSHQNFILIAQQAGLEVHWKGQAFWEALRMHHFQLFIDDEEPTPLSMSFLASVMRAWCWGLVLAGIAFAFEMKWHEYDTLILQLKRIWQQFSRSKN